MKSYFTSRGKTHFYLLIPIFFIFLFWLLYSCNHRAVELVNAPDSLPDLGGVFKFQETTYDFGQINNGDTAKHSFNFQNTGTGPIIIHDISTSCGCTIVDWPKEAIPPNGLGSINVQFSKKHDPGIHDKAIIIKANTKDPYTVIHIRALVSK